MLSSVVLVLVVLLVIVLVLVPKVLVPLLLLLLAEVVVVLAFFSNGGISTVQAYCYLLCRARAKTANLLKTSNRTHRVKNLLLIRHHHTTAF
jgi:hypothetical protein